MTQFNRIIFNIKLNLQNTKLTDMIKRQSHYNKTHKQSQQHINFRFINHKNQNNNQHNNILAQDAKAQKRSQNTPNNLKAQKQNLKFHQNTPKHCQATRMQEMDQFSQIKFISKEYSTIKQKLSEEIASYSNSDDRLEQFSGLFDQIYSKDSHDFQIQICGIEDSQSQFPIQDTNRISNSAILTSIRQSLKIGRIKKNNPYTMAKLQKPTLMPQKTAVNIEQEIKQIFQRLDGNSGGILFKNNCFNERLSIQVNYLIGSLINKIKVMDKDYRLSQFTQQFMKLIEDSEPEQLNQILLGNKKKKMKLSEQSDKYGCMQTDATASPLYEEQKIVANQCVLHPLNLTTAFHKPKSNILGDKLNHINAKLNLYLAKNDLLNRIDEHYQASKLCQIIKPTKTQTIKMGSSLLKQEYKGRQTILTNDSDEQGKLLYSLNSKGSLGDKSNVVQINFGKQFQIIKGCQGSQFELNFLQLNKHLH